MPLLETGRRVRDRWTHLSDTDAPPDEAAPVTVSLARLTAERDALLARPGDLGVRLPNAAAVADLVGLLDGDTNRLGLIVLTFPAFKDGRAYTQARQLRETHGYRGSLRATGDVLRDQFFFMARCGIDAVEVDLPESAAEAAWRSALDEVRSVYQPAADGRTPIDVLRRHTAPGREVAA
ncbi:DUF934 domain-containing protein [Roseospira navarrensis]|uniref:DUF934 domain-containing protein n=1 Tax=Roseospira navarrensis TaxID=140058 RepID=A0A7X1ZIV3_9PROT|nr:DUF934 domain-containing protein [Roseospira navarrensis]MQX38040.1 DUF934 domain-containing protein [Roseospira navarrensis]